MIIKTILIEQGLLYTERTFKSGFNLVFSKKNSTGKTTLLRCVLYGLGYNIPGTKNFRMETTSIELVLEKDDNSELVLKRKKPDYIELLKGEEQYSYALPTQLSELHEKLFGTRNVDILNNLLGAFYADQEKGWTLLNRGKVIAGIRFNINELIRGLSDRNCDNLILKKRKVEESLKKHRHILNIAEYRDKIVVDQNSLTGLNYDSERLLKIDQLKVERDTLKKEIKRLNNLMKSNRKTIELIEGMKLVIQLNTGENVCVTSDMIVGANDCIELLKAKKKTLIPQMNEVLKELEKLQLAVKNEEQQQSFFETESLADSFDKKMSTIDIFPEDVKSIIGKLEGEKRLLTKQISDFTNNNNSVTQTMIKTVQKYMAELEVPDAEKISWRYLFTSNLKELSGAILHNTVFSFRLAYILEIEKALGIKLPIILDSPKGKEIDGLNIDKMMQILKRDFPDNQIIVASIYHYVEKENIVLMQEHLLDKFRQSV